MNKDLPESPISVNTRIKSPNGFEYQLTLRNGVTEKDFSDLMTLIAQKEQVLLEKKWTPVAGYASKSGSKFPEKPVEYVPGRACPTCGSKLVYATKRDGSRFIKCSTNKYINGEATGCPYVDWGNTKFRPETKKPLDDYTDAQEDINF